MKYIFLFLLSLNLFSESLTLSLVEEIPTDIKSIENNLKTLNKTDYAVGVGVVGTTLLIMQFDEDIKEFANKNKSDTLDKLAPAFRKFGEFYPPLILISTGYLLDNEKSVETGIYATEASLLGLGITFLGKNIFTRARPYTGNGSNSWGNESFNKDYSSFPSGHSTVSFATATVIAEMYKDRKYIPKLSYTLATLAALSRIYDDKHWASDVILGSSIGYFSGKTLIKIKKNKNFQIVPIADSNGYGLTLLGKF
jgi:membrane-associated phospholipid phosphatase